MSTPLADKPERFPAAPLIFINGPRTLGDLITRPMASRIIVLERENTKLRADIAKLRRTASGRAYPDTTLSVRCGVEADWRKAVLP